MPTRLSLALLLLTLTACIEGHPPVNVGDIQRGPDATRSTVEVQPATGVPADGVSTARILVTVRDRNDTPLLGQVVAITATGSDNILVQPPATNANGAAEGTLASARAETKTLTITVGAGDKAVVLAQRPEVTFVPGSAGLVFITQPPGTASAGAAFAPPVRVRVEDSQGNVVTAPVDVTLSLEPVGNGATLGGSAQGKTAQGTAEFTSLNVEKAGTGYRLRATATGLTPAQSTPFDITAGAPDAANTLVEISRDNVEANGTDATTVTITVRDAYGNPVPGQSVGLAASGSGNTLSASSGTTGPNGTFSATLSSTLAELKTIQPSLGGTPVQQKAVTFIPGPPRKLAFLTQPPVSTVAGKAMVPAVRVRLLDAQNNPVAASDVTVQLALEATNGATLGGTVEQKTAAGIATFEGLNVAKVGTDYRLRATSGTLTSAQSDAFEIVADVPALDQTSLEVSKTQVTADGVDFTLITVTVKDAFGNPVAGQAVSVGVSGSNNFLSVESGATGTDGRFVTALRSLRAELKTIDVSVNSTSLAQKPNVTFVPGPAAKLAFVTQPPGSRTAGQTMTASVEVLDAQNNRVATSTSVALELEATNGATLAGTLTQNTSGGLASFGDLSVQKAGTGYRLIASVTDLPTVQSDTFDITADVPVTSTSTFTVAPTTVPADNTTEATLTVVVKDTYGNPVPGQSVSVSATGVGNTLTPTSGTSDVDGKFVARLKSTRAEVKTAEALVGTLAMTPRDVTFVAGPLATLTLTAEPSELEANGTAQSTLLTIAEDAFGNRISGLALRLSASGANNTFSAVTGSTDTDGQFFSALSSTSSGVKTVNVTEDGVANGKVGSTLVTFLRPSAQVSGVSVPASTAAGCAVIQYTVAQPQSARVDVAIEYEQDGVFKRATQAGSATGSGLLGLATSPLGVQHTFLWNSTADLPAFNGTTRLRLTTRLTGALPTSVLLDGVTVGNGLRFASPGLLPAGATAQHVGRADVNGDGRMDLVVGSASSSDIQVLLGDGMGSFGAPTAFSLGAGENATALVVRDITQDGKADVLAASSASNKVLLLASTSGGTPFLPVATAVTLSGAPRGLAVGDFNRDSRMDLAATTAAGTVEVALAGTTAGAFPALTVNTVGGTPQPIVAADVNLDDRLDLVLADPAGDVQVMIGTGTAMFGSASALSVGTGTVALAVADLNTDGLPDVVAARGASGVVSVARGNGNGTFNVQPPLTTGGTPSGLAVEDLDVDGRRDVVVAGVGSDVLVLSGQGNGSLSATPLVVPAGGLTAGVVVVDADRSGLPDVVATRPGGNGVSVLLNTQVDRCERALTAALQLPVAAQPTATATPDLNGDGRPDLVVASGGTGGANTLNVAIGRGNGTFSAFTSVPLAPGATNPQGVTSGDFNEDGRVDLVSANQGSGNVTVLIDNGGGGYTTSNVSTAAGARAVAAADFDADDNLDLAVANSTTGNVTVLWGNGDGTFPASQNVAVGSGPQALVVADLNGDGRPDLATVNSTGNNVTVLRNSGGRAFLSLGNTSLPYTPRAIVAGDYTSDNKLDLVVAGTTASANYVSVLRGQGTGGVDSPVHTLANSTTPEFGAPQGLAVGDFNLDGLLDVAVGHNLVRSITVLLGKPEQNGQFTFTAPLVAGRGIGSLTGADLDGDGRQDLVGTVNTVNRVTVLRGTDMGMTGARAFPLLAAGGTADGRSVRVADANRDGKLDLFFANTTASTMSLMLNDGTASFTDVRNHLVGSSANALVVGDINRDGKLDMMVALPSSNRISILQGDGAGGATALTPRNSSSARTLALLDIDLDGDLDLVAGGTSLTIHPNDGSGTFGSVSPVTSVGGEPRAFLTADFNGDGKLDVASANASSTNGVGVVLGNGTGGFGSPFKGVNLGVQCAGIAAGDFDRDGKVDLAATCGTSTFTVRMLKGVGDGTFSQVASLAPAGTGITAVEGVALGDVDGDGRLDVVTVALGTNVDSVQVWRGDGAGGFTGPTAWWTTNAGQSVALADLNGDGLLDAVTGGDTSAGVLLGH